MSNRQERRRLERLGEKVQKEAVINIKAADVAAMKQKAAEEAAHRAFVLMLAIPAMVLHDHFGFGKKRLEQFVDHVLNEYKMFEEDYYTIDDAKEYLRENTGIKYLG